MTARKEYTDRKEQVTDFVIGFFGWFIINAILVTVTQALSFFSVGFFTQVPLTDETATMALGLWSLALTCLPLVANVLVIARLSYTRRWVALGALAAFGATLFITLCAGAVILATCFTLMAPR
jgi:hypothetical protein